MSVAELKAQRRERACSRFRRAKAILSVIRRFRGATVEDPQQPKVDLRANVPPEDVINNPSKLGPWYWNQVFCQFIEEPLESTFRQFKRSQAQIVETFLGAWSHTDTFANCRARSENLYQGTAEGFLDFLDRMDLNQALQVTAIRLHTLSAASDRTDHELQRLNRHCAEYLDRLMKSQAFDPHRRCNDAYYGSVDRSKLMQRGSGSDLNVPSAIRTCPEYVETIHQNPRGYYLLVKSQVLLINGKPKCCPPPNLAPALHYAVLADKAGDVQQLLASGANRHVETSFGATALEIAIANDCRRVALILDPSRSWGPRTLSTHHRAMAPYQPAPGEEAMPMMVRDRRTMDKKNYFMGQGETTAEGGATFTQLTAKPGKPEFKLARRSASEGRKSREEDEGPGPRQVPAKKRAHSARPARKGPTREPSPNSAFSSPRKDRGALVSALKDTRRKPPQPAPLPESHNEAVDLLEFQVEEEAEESDLESNPMEQTQDDDQSPMAEPENLVPVSGSPMGAFKSTPRAHQVSDFGCQAQPDPFSPPRAVEPLESPRSGGHFNSPQATSLFGSPQRNGTSTIGGNNSLTHTHMHTHHNGFSATSSSQFSPLALGHHTAGGIGSPLANPGLGLGAPEGASAGLPSLQTSALNSPPSPGRALHLGNRSTEYRPSIGSPLVSPGVSQPLGSPDYPRSASAIPRKGNRSSDAGSSSGNTSFHLTSTTPREWSPARAKESPSTGGLNHQPHWSSPNSITFHSQVTTTTTHSHALSSPTSASSVPRGRSPGSREPNTGGRRNSGGSLPRSHNSHTVDRARSSSFDGGAGGDQGVSLSSPRLYDSPRR